MMRIGLLGCGNVAHTVAKKSNNLNIVSLYDLNKDAAADLEKISGAKAYDDFDEFLNSGIDIVAEAASVAAVNAFAEKILKSGRDMVILSVGALADAEFKEKLLKLAEENDVRIRIPSGAVIGLDNIKVCRLSEASKVSIHTTKNPKSLKTDLSERTLLFSGSAGECIKKFPKNVNVAVALELASGRPVTVELWADPAVKRNTHEIFASGDFGDITIKIENNPCPDNPATSYLAALSMIELLKNLDSRLIIGT